MDNIYSNKIGFKQIIRTEKRDLRLACVCVVGQGPLWGPYLWTQVKVKREGGKVNCLKRDQVRFEICFSNIWSFLFSDQHE